VGLFVMGCNVFYMLNEKRPKEGRGAAVYIGCCVVVKRERERAGGRFC